MDWITLTTTFLFEVIMSYKKIPYVCRYAREDEFGRYQRGWFTHDGRFYTKKADAIRYSKRVQALIIDLGERGLIKHAAKKN